MQGHVMTVGFCARTSSKCVGRAVLMDLRSCELYMQGKVNTPYPIALSLGIPYGCCAVPFFRSCWPWLMCLIPLYSLASWCRGRRSLLAACHSGHVTCRAGKHGTLKNGFRKPNKRCVDSKKLNSQSVEIQQME